ncbi:hypothetical protein [Bacillus safensis]|uniref:Uncharacterized protein n=2 Tax=Bacillus pumilus TaxID=1408 RepID=A0A9Q9T4L5_BACPU|nr:hypothetical protein [Bacillus safensis]VCT93328.1 hypothetical protein SBRMV_043 [Bacillus pumilus]MCY7710857.1 hypothetical protein [Bacillus safensis]MCY7726873.1 hypothetical protein [Bacillus safensis]MED4594651.1 hypothetical protein [Bacillus safensis]MED4639432.1 hypothetical protein [Bacillus safensis]
MKRYYLVNETQFIRRLRNLGCMHLLGTFRANLDAKIQEVWVFEGNIFEVAAPFQYLGMLVIASFEVVRSDTSTVEIEFKDFMFVNVKRSDLLNSERMEENYVEL